MTAPGQGPDSPVFPLHAAIATLLKGDVDLSALIGGRVYSLMAPEDAPLDYVVLGSTDESAWDAFMRRGAATGIMIDVYSQDGETINGMAAIYGRVRKLLHGTRLVLEGHVHVTGRLELIDVIPDPPTRGTHGVLRYTAASKPAPVTP